MYTCVLVHMSLNRKYGISNINKKKYVYAYVHTYMYMYYVHVYMALSQSVALARMHPSGPDSVRWATQQTLSAVSHSRHDCVVAQQTFLLNSADMSPMSHRRARLPCDTAETVCYVTQQTCLLFCATAETSAV